MQSCGIRYGYFAPYFQIIQSGTFIAKVTVMNRTHGNWIDMQCAKWGRVTFGKESLKTIFTATDRNLFKQLKDYCSERKLKMQADKTRSLFTFQLTRNHRVALPINWVH